MLLEKRHKPCDAVLEIDDSGKRHHQPECYLAMLGGRISGVVTPQGGERDMKVPVKKINPYRGVGEVFRNLIILTNRRSSHGHSL
ncbi:MAG: hypothetical protein JOY71_29445 [Acetobacteraceae bacterium]|nr:hypothetical protein [Acetobacteraceae bacterium]